MKTFFYANNMDNCSECCWQLCPRRYLSQLQVHNVMHDIQPYSSEFISHHCMDGMPRHGDIIILYAENQEELERIIAHQDSFDGMKKILVIGDPEGIDGDRYHRLEPRFITMAKRPVDEVDAVVRRMKNGLQSKGV